MEAEDVVGGARFQSAPRSECMSEAKVTAVRVGLEPVKGESTVFLRLSEKDGSVRHYQ